MADTMKTRIDRILSRKQGNKELAIMFDGKDQWWIMLGNPSRHVMLGEASGELETEFNPTLEDAISEMEDLLNGTQ